MKTGRTTAVIGATVALVVGLGLGSLGTATASGLTPGAVKRIAKQVVNKRAGTLSVAHADTATTATTATTLQGSTAAQLTTHAYTYALPREAATTHRDYTFPGLPAGTYLVSYSLTMEVSGGFAQCSIAPLGLPTGPIALVSYADDNAGVFNAASAAGVVTVTPDVDLYCLMTDAATFRIYSPDGIDSSVSFVPIEVPVRSTAVGGPGA